MKKTNNRVKIRGPVMGAAIGVFVAVLLSFALVLFSPIFIINEYWRGDAENYIIPIFQAIMVLLGAYIAGSVADRQKMLATITVGTIYILLLSAIAILTFNGISVRFAITFIACLVGQVSAIYLALKPKKSLIRKSRRAANR